MKSISYFVVALVISLFSIGSAHSGLPIELECVGIDGVDNHEDFELDGLFRAEIEGRRRVITYNPRLLSNSYWNPVTLEFLYQRECQKISSASALQHDFSRAAADRLDCQAFQRMLQKLNLHGYQAGRAAKTIERDFNSDLESWPASMGPPRSVSLRDCGYVD